MTPKIKVEKFVYSALLALKTFHTKSFSNNLSGVIPTVEIFYCDIFMLNSL